jgi:hypothetical protein
MIDDIPAGRRPESHAHLQHNRRSSGGLSDTRLLALCAVDLSEVYLPGVN